ncbi:PREDICTED: uncharacterized protein [Sparassis crispa]|uniref:PREDICTED: uncharacterized protein n=1 Tax=Sparassis crispa TaxID=139825 RepID=A0A401H3A1_9APHY|nr:PREDICTED: uncharacterized protein [Sparassis crispa]GBE88882.1 PREDICTED: uncharacterized protein [Sparassis crispa]
MLRMQHSRKASPSAGEAKLMPPGMARAGNAGESATFTVVTASRPPPDFLLQTAELRGKGMVVPWTVKAPLAWSASPGKAYRKFTKELELGSGYLVDGRAGYVRRTGDMNTHNARPYCTCSLVVEQAKGVQEVEQAKGVQEVEQAKGVQEVEQAKGVQEVEQAKGVQEVEQAKGVQEVEQAKGVQEVEQAKGVQEVEQAKGVQEVEQAKGVQEVEQAKGVQEVEQAKGVQEVEQAKGVQEVEQAKGVQEVERCTGGREISNISAIRKTKT